MRDSNESLDKINWGPSEGIARFNRGKFEEFATQSPAEIEAACRNEEGRLIHLLRAEHFDLPFLETICETTTAARRIAKLRDNSLKNLLKAYSVLNYFSQPSSRTFLSFSMAEAHLGMRREEVRDLRTSSTAKGESDRDALRTSSSYFDVIVCRTPSDIFDLFALWVMKTSDREISIINAGSGAKEHPTQAVLDYYTIKESFGGEMANKTGLYVGDCLRGRTVHSLAKVLALHPRSTAYFISPEHLQVDPETEQFLLDKKVTVHKISDKHLRELVPLADFVYMTRIQDEHGGNSGYDPRFIFTRAMLDEMKPGAILMHPLPKREEIDPAIDYLHKDPRVMYWREMRNGMWARVALIAHLFGVDQQIREQYAKIKTATAPKPL